MPKSFTGFNGVDSTPPPTTPEGLTPTKISSSRSLSSPSLVKVPLSQSLPVYHEDLVMSSSSPTSNSPYQLPRSSSTTFESPSSSLDSPGQKKELLEFWKRKESEGSPRFLSPMGTPHGTPLGTPLGSPRVRSPMRPISTPRGTSSQHSSANNSPSSSSTSPKMGRRRSSPSSWTRRHTFSEPDSEPMVTTTSTFSPAPAPAPAITQTNIEPVVVIQPIESKKDKEIVVDKVEQQVDSNKQEISPADEAEKDSKEKHEKKENELVIEAPTAAAVQTTHPISSSPSTTEATTPSIPTTVQEQPQTPVPITSTPTPTLSAPVQATLPTPISTPTPTPTPTPTQPKLPARDLVEDTKRIWLRPFASQPVGVDLPRLASCISIFKDNSSTEDLAEKGNPKKTVYDVLQGLRQFFAPEFTLDDEFIQKYDAIPRNEDSTFRTNDLVAYLSTEFQEPILNILKVCSQAIIAPSVIELRLSICPKPMFKDAGGWTIKVSRDSENNVVVSHCKKQQQMDLRKEEEYFEFVWELQMVFDSEATLLKHVALSIVELNFGEKTTPERKQECHAVFDKHFKCNKTPSPALSDQ
ncbi:hypothetical protein SAMD00019534_118610 [Acytostelium subglobosum LB1]|uniref:hypothetical protein n=1 Tax=Acytostelium subglobosum LB1 TaxID=1410327 RepID=UPI0006450A23|nr:hypothetical protein SAMD00019534_118610 [Acytostelium subglobosum LB1]GAM28685.1 hypothetical protein SAMD00019534_118610 [Acytostelium subglobosum LB1]|eukprot:XP_012748463.1 hypothetical protein SAMD00019534_118610 [Acytostelium subglobosum LB1]